MPTPSIFPHKQGGDRYQGTVGAVGAADFESARARLAKLAGWPVADVSDADTMEFLARVFQRGEADVKRVLARRA